MIARADGKVLIVREGKKYEDGTELGKWDVVGGRIEPEESIYAGLRREVQVDVIAVCMVPDEQYATVNYIPRANT